MPETRVRFLPLHKFEDDIEQMKIKGFWLHSWNIYDPGGDTPFQVAAVYYSKEILNAR